MQHAMEAYNQAVKTTENPRDTEAAVLTKAANRLAAVRDNWEHRGTEGLLEALHYNRQVWTVLAASVTSKDNDLPTETRSNVASLGAFVFKQTISIQARPEPTMLDSLININRQLVSGLQTG
jgi:flagellar protein FlaF